MFKGNVVSIHIASAPGNAMQSVDEVHAVPGHGLEGDRYFNRPGILGGLIHRGGLRAQILNDGVIKVGDAVEGA